MVQLNPLVDFSTTPITRQTLFDAWSTATIGQLSEADLATDVKPIVAQASPPTEAPGRLWWNTREQLAFVYTDELDGTGVSLWLAWGPDRLDTACLAAEPIGAGAVVDAWYDRHVKVAQISEGSLGDAKPRILGANQSGVHYPLNEGTSITTASGAWCAVAIEGLPYVFTPFGFAQRQWVALHAGSTDGKVDAFSSSVNPPNTEIVLGLMTQNQTTGYNPSAQPNGVHYVRMLWGVRRMRGLD